MASWQAQGSRRNSWNNFKRSLYLCKLRPRAALCMKLTHSILFSHFLQNISPFVLYGAQSRYTFFVDTGLVPSDFLDRITQNSGVIETQRRNPCDDRLGDDICRVVKTTNTYLQYCSRYSRGKERMECKKCEQAEVNREFGRLRCQWLEETIRLFFKSDSCRHSLLNLPQAGPILQRSTLQIRSPR